MKTKIKKHLRKYISVACSLFLIPIFSISSFASSVVLDLYQYYLMSNPLYFGVYTQGYFDSNGNSTGSGSALFTKSDLVIDSSGYYNVSNTSSFSNVNVINFENTTAIDTYPVVNDFYDYYLVATVCFDPISWDYFTPDSLQISRKENNAHYNYSYSDLNVKVISTSRSQGFQLSCKINFSYYVFYDRILFVDSSNGQLGNNISYNCFILPVLKNTSSEELNSIIAAINNQTFEIGGKIDDTNDLIEDGNSGTQSAITDFNEVFEDFNAELENIEEFDNSIISEFESANEKYLTELNNFSLSASLLNAGNWLSTSMQTVYDNSSDYKMLWLVPLLLGIPLIILFLKKGSDDE